MKQGWRNRIGCWCAGIALGAGTAIAADAPVSSIAPEVRAVLLHHLKFLAAEITNLERGKIVRRVLAKDEPREVAVAGAVRVKVTGEAFVQRFRDVARFKRSPAVLQIGRFGNPPVIDDLASLTIDQVDLEGLRKCRVGDCDVRLPAATIQRFQNEIDWRAPDAAARATALFRQVLVEYASSYLATGNGVMGEYSDGPKPLRPAEDFAGIVRNSPYLGALAPGLPEHIEGFPGQPLAGAEDFLYWSKEKFGFKPVTSLTHVTIAKAPSGAYVITSKDIYSSHYLDASLGFTVVSEVVGAPDSIYLVYVNRSRADALDGGWSALRRSIVERRAKNGLQENLNLAKIRLEQGS